MTSQPAKPLSCRAVVVTRARAQAMDFVSELENYGARVLICPTIEITELENYERLDEAINHLYGYDWIIFTSTNGVEYFLRRFKSGGFELSNLDELRVCAIGDATEAKLHDEHVHVDIVPRDFKAEGVFAALEQFVGGREALHGLNFSSPAPPPEGISCRAHLRKLAPALMSCPSIERSCLRIWIADASQHCSLVERTASRSPRPLQ